MDRGTEKNTLVRLRLTSVSGYFLNAPPYCLEVAPEGPRVAVGGEGDLIIFIHVHIGKQLPLPPALCFLHLQIVHSCFKHYVQYMNLYFTIAASIHYRQ